MTIPIVPGPFAFLAQLGQAGGEAFAQAEKARQQRLKEAQDRLNQMITLRSAGLIKPEAFGTPEAFKLYKDLGIEPITSEATPGEQLQGLRGEYLTNLKRPEQAAQINLPLQSLGLGPNAQVNIPGKRPFSDEELRLLGLPTSAQLAVEKTQGAEAAAKLPEIPTTTTAGQFQTQDEQFNAVADRVVQDLYTSKGNKLPTDKEAFDAAQTDERYRAFGPKKITQPYFGQAIERLRSKLAAEETARRMAAARLAGAAGTGLDDLARVYLRQVDQLTTQLRALKDVRGVTDADASMYSVWQTNERSKKKTTPYIEERAKIYESYLLASQNLQSQIDFYQQKASSVIGPAMGVEPPPSPFNIEQQRRDWDEAAKALKDQGKNPDEVIGPRP